MEYLIPELSVNILILISVSCHDYIKLIETKTFYKMSDLHRSCSS